MLTSHLQLKMKSKIKWSFLMYWLYGKIKQLLPLSTVNLPLLEFICILTAFYHLPISLVLFTYITSFEYAQFGLELLHTELVFLKQIFLKNRYSENFVNKCFKRFMANINVIKGTILTIQKKALVIVFLYLHSVSLGTRTNGQKIIKKHP